MEFFVTLAPIEFGTFESFDRLRIRDLLRVPAEGNKFSPPALRYVPAELRILVVCEIKKW
jgi:hypothetical protein